ncbi:MAG TPA: helix-turn-helix domain-containing protein [Alphaproteobacteria bacterium]|nr:helix-turn-helix domain-containing protein [Alphaproteobacteria bacterium]
MTRKRYVAQSVPKNIPPYAALHLLSKVQEIGGDANAILRNAKLPLALEDFERGAVRTLSHAHFTALYRECILQLEAHANRQSGRLSMELNETRMLYYCIINCRTLREAIVRSVEFFDMLDRGIRLRLEFVKDTVDFVMETRRAQRNSASFLSDLVGLSSFHQFYGWMLGEPIPVRDVQMLYDPSFEKDIFTDFFQVPVRLGGRANQFRIGAEMLDRPVIRSYHELETLLETFPLDIMPVDYKTGRIAGHVRNIMYNALLGRAVLPHIPDLAAAFGLSSATLRRRLANEHTSIGRIREACRRQLAEELLLNHGESIQGIAARLGFSDTTSFRRAFKKWTGEAPSKCRAAN